MTKKDMFVLSCASSLFLVGFVCSWLYAILQLQQNNDYGYVIICAVLWSILSFVLARMALNFIRNSGERVIEELKSYDYKDYLTEGEQQELNMGCPDGT